tara:strand:+ start:131 stop:1543 length:1413 start_codon:yes stop_codon:yes gene_type:complete
MSKTSKIASDLYNKGFITYIRTDSTRTSSSARESAKSIILEKYGHEFLGDGSLGPDSKKGSANVQDAHEAIRPTDPKLEKIEDVDEDSTRLYSLIRSRFISSQMSDSVRERREISGTVTGTKLTISGTASWRIHSGWEVASEQFLPEPRIVEPKYGLADGSVWEIDDKGDNPVKTTDETKPPRRFTESSIVKKMKSAGIGRPSTYVSTVQKLSDRKYVSNDNGSLTPTENGMVLWTEVAPIYNDQNEQNKLFSSEFTADMEKRLDMIEEGMISGSEIWDSFTKSFKIAHDNALEIRRSKPTPKQIWAIENRIIHLPEEKQSELLGGNKISDLTGNEASELIEKLIATEGENGGPKPSEKQINYLTSLIDKSNMSEEEALKLVDVSDFSELIGGRNGTASVLIGLMKEVNESLPASEPQIDLIKSMAEKQGLPMRDVLAMAELADESDITKSEASKIISKLKSMNKKRKRK